MVALPAFAALPLLVGELLVGPLSEPALPWLDWAKAPAVDSARMQIVVVISFLIPISCVRAFRRRYPNRLFQGVFQIIKALLFGRKASVQDTICDRKKRRLIGRNLPPSVGSPALAPALQSSPA
jgi:hypothetical protein